MYLPKVKKITVSPFDDKCCSESSIESERWNHFCYIVVEVEENFPKTRHMKKNDKAKNYILGGGKK